MEQKRISFKVAKAIKEIGYPLIKIESGRYDGTTPIMYDKELNEENWVDCDAWYLPTYLDVWLWLWRENKIVISSDYIDYTSSWMSTIETDEMYTEFHDKYDPEEAIIAAIDYLVDNNLIK